MNKPYIVCYMMTSVDGRIDCGMTSQLPGVQEYYPLLKELDLGTAVRGKTTAKLELAEPGEFTADSYTAVEKELVSKKADNSKGYTVVVDTKGLLLDGTVPDEQILDLLDMSYQMTAKKKKQKVK